MKRDPYRVELALLLLSFPILELVSSMQIAVHFGSLTKSTLLLCKREHSRLLWRWCKTRHREALMCHVDEENKFWILFASRATQSYVPTWALPFSWRRNSCVGVNIVQQNYHRYLLLLVVSYFSLNWKVWKVKIKYLLLYVSAVPSLHVDSGKWDPVWLISVKYLFWKWAL